MKIDDPFLFSFAKIRCKIFGHFFKISKDVTDHLREYRCQHCGLEMTDTASGFWARLTPKFKETNEYIARIHQRRKRRLLKKVS
jgi:hypothetical protein